ncbi:MAG: hypothetical protein ACOH2A_04455 [Sphingobacteriaceae bacterium]
MNFKILDDLLGNLSNNLSTMNYEEVKYYCTKYLNSVPMSVVDFDNSKFYFGQHEGGANLLYRARVITHPNVAGHEKVEDISYMPDHKLHLLKDFGRVNKPGEAIFYGSLDWMTACIEAISKGINFETDNSLKLTVGTWAFRSPLTFVQMPRSLKYFSKFYEIIRHQQTKITVHAITQANKKIYKDARNETDVKILSFFADEFAKFNLEGDCDYKLSNYYADRVFNSIKGCYTDPVDGIIYPSIPNSYEKLNVALKPQVIKDGKLVFVDAMQVWVTDPMGKHNQTQFTPIIQNIDADVDGNLKWPYLN